jgi:hypothetical protein
MYLGEPFYVISFRQFERKEEEGKRREVLP